MAEAHLLNGNSLHVTVKNSDGGKASALPVVIENTDSSDGTESSLIEGFPNQTAGVRRRLNLAESGVKDEGLEGIDLDPTIPGDNHHVPKRPRRSSQGEDEDSCSTRDSMASCEGDESTGTHNLFPTSPSAVSESASDTGNSPHKKSRILFNPFKRICTTELKKTGASFVQDGTCYNKCPNLQNRCLECRNAESGIRNRVQPHLFCRFYGFRKLKYVRVQGQPQVTYAGFSDPCDSKQSDVALWLPSDVNIPTTMGIDMCTTLLNQVGDQFCDLIHQEKEAVVLNVNPDTKTRAKWKRVVPGVRDMCDICDTTLFNHHWVCEKCGFVACIACYKSRKFNIKKDSDEEKENECEDSASGKLKDRDEFKWLLCNSKTPHSLEVLMLTQVIAGDALNKINEIFHEVRNEWKIPQECNCEEAKKYKEINEGLDGSDSSRDSDDDEEREGMLSIRSLCARVQTENGDGSEIVQKFPSVEDACENSTNDSNKFTQPLKYFVREGGTSKFHRQQQPIRTFTWRHSTSQFPDLAHSWFCHGQLLKLEDPLNSQNMKLFQEMWKRGQPVMVTNINNKLNAQLWTPQSFGDEFSGFRNDLVNCLSGKTVPCQSFKRFWEGFENVGKRLKDNDGNPMLLKLKDWPSTDDFAELLPSRFEDLMNALPLTEYTHRDGRLNLAARLPGEFVKPDLGPKMYIAYGSGLHLDKGTTNLHLDISDAVNVMVYVGMPTDIDNTEHIQAVTNAISDSDCERQAIETVLAKIEQAGALWHIYKSSDADKIRDFLNKVAMERQNCLEPDHDPIHDQSWYLDKDLRKRLMAEYGVSGYPIVQCLGDAIFIPAGAPHQVRNFNNCIKIAEDFVSPENVSHCFDLTEEFRQLPETHQNHEDKLQIKNIIYHAVKDALAVLKYSEEGRIQVLKNAGP